MSCKKDNVYMPFYISKRKGFNYDLLLRLYLAAEYDTESSSFCIVRYVTIEELADRLSTIGCTMAEMNNHCYVSITRQTLYNFINDSEVKRNFIISRTSAKGKENTIILNSNVKKCASFVKLPFVNAIYLLRQRDSKLTRLYIYLFYYCGLNTSKGQKTNFTANQYLKDCGYSATSNDSAERVFYSLVKKLNDDGKIYVSHYLDEFGHKRNEYSIISVENKRDRSQMEFYVL